MFSLQFSAIMQQIRFLGITTIICENVNNQSFFVLFATISKPNEKQFFAMKRLILLFALILSFLVGHAQSVHIGDILCTDGSTVRPEQFASSGKTAEGIVFYVDNTDSHGWAVALNNQSTSIKWCNSDYYGYDIPELPNFEDARTAMHDLNGIFNTGIVRNVDFNFAFPAVWAVDYDNGWYLPSAGQLRYLYSCFPEINASLQVVGGTLLPYHSNNYWWSSTEYSGYHAFDMNSGGSIGDYVKDNHVNYPANGIAVRQIRDFQIQNPVHPAYHIGDLITNDDGSQGVLFYVNPDQTGGWMVALNDASNSVFWGNNTDVPNLNNQTCSQPFGALLDETNGFANTEIIRNHQYGMTTAANAVDYQHGWYLPTAGQLLKLFGSLAFIEDKLQTYGNTLAEDFYWSSSEATASQAFALSCAPMANVRAGHCVRCEKSQPCHVRAVRNIQLSMNPPIVGDIATPESICSGTSLELTIPQTQFAANQGWQLSPTSDFNNPIPYNGNSLGFEYNGWYLRYFVSNYLGTAYSNTVQITVWPIYETSFDTITCTDYVWNGITYTESGIYTQHLSSVHGCDSVVTLNLSLDSINKREVFINGCDEITFNGITYTQSGHFEQTVPGSTGCDTLIDLYLSISQMPYVSQIHGESLIYYQTNGNFTYSIDPVEGCFGYEWSIDNFWSINTSPDSPECVVNINSPGTTTLKLRVYTECGFIERSLFINHDARPEIVIYPNPTKDDFNLKLYGMEGTAYIVIYDYLGQLVDRFSVETTVGGTIVPYSLAGKAAGVYLVSVKNNYYMVAKKVVKETASSYGFFNWDW